LNCSLKDRVYTSDYLFFKLLYGTYLRLLIGPGILLNTLCLFVLSRPRLSNKSTTIVFLRFLAIFDILAITLKYIRSEINYQSLEKDTMIMTSVFCKILYVFMNASISIAMWTIVLMSLDKAVAVSYPLKSGIWVTPKRAFYGCCFISFILSMANLYFIRLSGVTLGNNNKRYCGLIKDSLIIDVTTASILPISLITLINIVIAVTVNCVSHTSLDLYTTKNKIELQSSSSDFIKKGLISTKYRIRFLESSSSTTDRSQAMKRRISAQVTRMLLAVTLSLIIFNIPNTIVFLYTRINDHRSLFKNRQCFEVNILSDLPHVVNFFLYCLAGKKFRSIFLNEIHHCCIRTYLIRKKQRYFTQNGSIINGDLSYPAGFNSSQRQILYGDTLSKFKKTTNASFNALTNKLIFNDENHNEFINENENFLPGQY
ncbi:unnamed protein product, partial [Rotaria sp. Silwood1]